jgi:hypothetical protein
MGTDSYADVVERLFGEFDWALPLPEITRLVGQCRQDWSGSTALEGLEIEARRLLTDLSLVARPDPPTRLVPPAPVWGPQQESEVGETTLAPV